MEVWNSICSDMARAEKMLFSSDSSPDEEDTCAELTLLGRIRSFLAPQSLEQVWLDILKRKLAEDQTASFSPSGARNVNIGETNLQRFYESPNTSRTGKDAQGLAFSLLSGHRLLANYLALTSRSDNIGFFEGLDENEEMSLSGYHIIVLRPLLSSLGSLQNHTNPIVLKYDCDSHDISATSTIFSRFNNGAGAEQVPAIDNQAHHRAIAAASTLISSFPLEAKVGLLRTLCNCLAGSTGRHQTSDAAATASSPNRIAPLEEDIRHAEESIAAQQAISFFSESLCIDLGQLLQRCWRNKTLEISFVRTGVWDANSCPMPIGNAGSVKLLRLLVQRALRPISRTQVECEAGSLQHLWHAASAAPSLPSMSGIVAVLDALVLDKPAQVPTSAMAEIISCLPGQVISLFCATDHIACLWADRAFVRRPNARAHTGVTAALLALLARLEGAIRTTLATEMLPDHACSQWLSRPAPSGAALIVTLSSGVSSYLDCTDNQSRSCGIRVAKRFSGMLGMQSAFAEIDDAFGSTASHTGESPLADTPASNTLSASNIAVGSVPDTHASPSGMAAATTEPQSDSDSDLEPLGLAEPPAAGTVGGTVYLRACADMLRMDPAAKGAAEKQEIALAHLPRILSTGPADGSLLAATLTQTLLTLGNHFNLDHFDDFKEASMQTLLCMFPYQAVPVTAAAVLEKDMLLASRIWAVGQLAIAARSLAGVPSAYNTQPRNDPPQPPKPHSNPSEQHGSIDAAIAGRAIAGRVRIKRPRQLAILRQQAQSALAARNSSVKGQSRLRSNPIAPVLNLFAAPLVELLRVPQMQVKRETDEIERVEAAVRTMIERPSTGGHIRTLNVNDKLCSSSVIDDASVGGGANDLDALLVSEALLALSSLVSCARHTMHQRSLLESTLAHSLQWLQSPHLVVRRAALAAALESVEAWRMQRSEQQSNARASILGGSSALDTLTNIAGRTVQAGQPPLAIADGNAGAMITALVDAALVGLRSDPDAQSRQLRAGLARAVLALDEGLDDGNQLDGELSWLG